MYGAFITLYLFVAVCSRLPASGQHWSALQATAESAVPQNEGVPLRTTMPDLVVGTRLHLGNATVPPPDKFWSDKLESFGRFCADCGGSGESGATAAAAQGVVAVDGADKIPGYSLVETIRRLVASSSMASTASLEVLPVCPWGRFVPALNALVLHAASAHRAKRILFVSAETTAPKSSIDALLSEMKKEDGSDDESVLVAGARLAGHDYRAAQADTASLVVPLNGRTSPWNTLAVWNLKKLAITGFQLVSDALITDDDKNREPWYAGIEEVVAIALLQTLLGRDQARAKLVHVPGITWDQTFDDPERKKWHEYKMESKATRAAHQLELTNIDGEVIHC
jgi:hypothetical protein